MTIKNGTAGRDILFIDSGRTGDTLNGLGGGDDLVAFYGAGGNTLNGGDGDDALYGYQNDTLTGGADFDLFELSGIKLPNAPNIITDFNPDEDAIQVDVVTGTKVSDVPAQQVGNDTIVYFGTTPLAIVKNTLVNDVTRDNNLRVVSNFTIPVPPAPVNLAPTGIVFSNTVASLVNNTSTASRIKIADFAVTDDGIGTNNLSLAGTDANSFEIVGNTLSLKAGTVLNSSTKTSFSAVVNVDDPTVGSNPDATQSFTLTTTAPPVVPPVIEPTPAPLLGVSLTKNLFVTGTTVKGFGINAVIQKPTNKVSEIGIFAVDDTSGSIGGIAPGAAGYLKAVTDSARSIFSTLGGTFFSTGKRELALDPNKTYQLFEVQDGSIADLQQQIAGGKTPTNVLFSSPDTNGNSPFKITAKGQNAGYLISVNNDELVLNMANTDGLTPNTPPGAKSQGLAQGRIFDLTGSAGAFKVDITTTSDAAYNNSIGFYAVEDTNGTIKTANGTFKPGDANYAIEAVKSALLQTGKTDSKLNQDIDGGKIYAPVVIAQGTFNDFTTKNPTNGGDGTVVHAYFNYLGANPDKLDHFRLLGNNTFGFEDMYGGGDRDFNDVVINVAFKQQTVVA
ncbi:DUF4114 domain-containing protein [Chamaesiphon sp.]|uniref:DUF4114 domain-containing protein n=1 Tax=Chamaesiphon sp. TaxID=2814140 RepID=UPI00359324BD